MLHLLLGSVLLVTGSACASAPPASEDPEAGATQLFAPMGGTGDDHPLAWYHSQEGGKAFYTALGHTAQTFQEPLFLGHLLGGNQWAAGISP